MEPIDDNSAQNSAMSESLQTVPIYNLDASPSDSDSDDNRYKHINTHNRWLSNFICLFKTLNLPN